MALFKKYSIKKNFLMADAEAVDEAKLVCEKISDKKNTGYDETRKLLKLALVKKDWLGREQSLTDEEVNKIPYEDGQKYALDFFFLLMKRETSIAKHSQNLARRFAKPLKK